MAKSFEDRWWEWLRVGKRIELVVLLFGAFSFLAFAFPGILHFGKDVDPGAAILILLIAGGLGSLTFSVPLYFLLRFRRKKWRGTLLEEGKSCLSDPGVRTLPRSRGYALLAVVTLISAAFQATHMEIFGRLFGPSIVGVFCWNFGILGAVLAIIELVRGGKNSKPTK